MTRTIWLGIRACTEFIEQIDIKNPKFEEIEFTNYKVFREAVIEFNVKGVLTLNGFKMIKKG